MTTTVEQQVSDNKVTGHHAWDRVCVNTLTAKHNQQIEIGMRAGRVEWSSRAAECRTEQPCLAESRAEQSNRSETVPRGVE